MGDLDVSLNASVLDTSQETTTTQLLLDLRNVWRNERLSPELLPHHIELVDCLLEQINGVKENIEQQRTEEPHRCFFHKLELQRVHYMLSNYLGCRLEKIQNFCMHFNELPVDQQEHLLSPAELELCRGFHQKTMDHIESSLIPYFPPEVPITEQWKKQPLRPKLDTFVFVKPKEPLNSVILGPDDMEDLEKDGQYLLRYAFIRDHVVANKVILM